MIEANFTSTTNTIGINARNDSFAVVRVIPG